MAKDLMKIPIIVKKDQIIWKKNPT